MSLVFSGPGGGEVGWAKRGRAGRGAARGRASGGEGARPLFPFHPPFAGRTSTQRTSRGSSVGERRVMAGLAGGGEEGGREGRAPSTPMTVPAA